MPVSLTGVGTKMNESSLEPGSDPGGIEREIEYRRVAYLEDSVGPLRARSWVALLMPTSVIPDGLLLSAVFPKNLRPSFVAAVELIEPHPLAPSFESGAAVSSEV